MSLPEIEPLLIGYQFRSTVTISNELFRLFTSLCEPTQTLHLQVELMSLIKWKFLYRATANGLYAVRRVPAKVQAELLWPPATSKHTFPPFPSAAACIISPGEGATFICTAKLYDSLLSLANHCNSIAVTYALHRFMTVCSSN